jgi:putative Mg2+ transporter-C (MgtC) family protein
MSPIEQSAIIEIAIAALLGALIGLERTLAGKPAGLRTYSLVSLGSCLLTVVGVLVDTRAAAAGIAFEPLQLAGTIVIGVGFIGSGIVFRQERHAIGLTSAAGVWVAAAVGIAVGFGYHSLAIAATILTVIVFGGLSRIEEFMERRFGRSAETRIVEEN